jgi:hypothetical protein
MVQDPLIIHWIKNLGLRLEELLHLLLSVKKFHCWRWMSCTPTLKKSNQIRVGAAADRNQLHFAGFEVGNASSQVLRKLWNKIAKTNGVEIVCTD